MGLERENKQERKANSGILKAGLVAASLLAPYEHGKLEAAEIPPQATWEQGVAELRRSVMEEPVEYSAVAATLPNRNTIWPRTLRGEIDGVKAYYTGTVQQLVNQTQGQLVLNYCDIHTHPVASIVRDFNVALQAKQAYAPPSAGDAFVVTRGGRQDVIPKFATENGLQIQNVTAAVFDPRGVWYYRTLTGAERIQYGTSENPFSHQDEFIKEVHAPFTTSSVLPNFNFKVEYEKLRTAYRQRIGTEIRFVSYEDLTDEPPCAGPDYKSEEKK